MKISKTYCTDRTHLEVEISNDLDEEENDPTYEEEQVNHDDDQTEEEEETTISNIVKAISNSNKPTLKSEGDHKIGQKDAQSQGGAALAVAKTTSSP